MFTNYLKTAIRNFLKHKIHSLISVFSLTIGMAVAIMIMMWVQDELSYDGYHTNAKYIYHVYKSVYTNNNDFWTLNTSAPLANDLKENYNEILNTARLGRTGELLLRYRDKLFNETKIACVDPSYFKIFTLPFLNGDPKTALSNPFSLVLTENMAKKYFGNENPVGKSIKVNNKFDCLVTGVIRNIPANTNFKFDAFLPFSFLKNLGLDIDHYGTNDLFTYVLLRHNINYESINRKIFESFTNPNLQPNTVEKYYLIPLTEVRFYRNAHQIVVDVFSILAFIILLIACINYINISTAQSAIRAGEVGIRKVFGASLSNIRYQFLSENLLIAFASFCLALLLVEISLPVFNNLSGKQLIINYLDFKQILVFIAILLITGIIAGGYPAFFLSSFKPVSILKKNIPGYSKRISLRRVLVVVQFTFSIMLIISTIYLYRQIDFLQNSDFGFDNKNIIFTNLRGESNGKINLLKYELLKDPNIVSVTSSNNLPNSNGYYVSISDAEHPSINSNALWNIVDYDYLKTFNMKLATGRFFSKDYSTDKEQSVVVNESLASALKLSKPVGQTISFQNKKYTIVGVIADFHNRPLVYPIEPMILTLSENYNSILFVKMKQGSEYIGAGTVKFIKDVCSKFSTDYPLEFMFLDQVILEGTDDMQGAARVLLLFAIFGIIIACLGLYGLASFIVEQRTKEIGIRKVLGSPVAGIVHLFSREFMRLIIIAYIIACPAAYIFISNAIQSAYNPPFSIWIFVFTSLAVILLSFSTISYHTIKAATANPVKSLRYE